MKNLIIGFVILGSAQSFAQVVDYDSINQRNADRINREYSESVNRTVDRITQHFRIDGVKFPKKEKYTSIDRAQISLVSCVRNLIQKHKGGYDSARVSQSILLSAFLGDSLSKEEKVLKRATTKCEDAYQNLYNFKNKVIDTNAFRKTIEELPSSNVAENKAKNALFSLYSRSQVVCTAKVLSATAAFGIGLDAGITNLKCLISDGHVKNYSGIALGFAGGFGAVVGIRVEDIDSNVSMSDVFEAHDLSMEYDVGGLFDNITFVIGAEESNGNYGTHADGISVGLGVILVRHTAGVGVRSFNGTPRWNTILNQLN